MAARSTLDINPGRCRDTSHVTTTNHTIIVFSFYLDLSIDAQQYKVFPGTEKDVYTNGFFQRQDLVVNALDNVEARRYVDGRCVTNLTPLLESGTMGAKGHVQVDHLSLSLFFPLPSLSHISYLHYCAQVIVPHQTESYSSQVSHFLHSTSPPPSI